MIGVGVIVAGGTGVIVGLAVAVGAAVSNGGVNGADVPQARAPYTPSPATTIKAFILYPGLIPFFEPS